MDSFMSTAAMYKMLSVSVMITIHLHSYSSYFPFIPVNKSISISQTLFSLKGSINGITKDHKRTEKWTEKENQFNFLELNG